MNYFIAVIAIYILDAALAAALNPVVTSTGLAAIMVIQCVFAAYFFLSIEIEKHSKIILLRMKIDNQYIRRKLEGKVLMDDAAEWVEFRESNHYEPDCKNK